MPRIRLSFGASRATSPSAASLSAAMRNMPIVFLCAFALVAGRSESLEAQQQPSSPASESAVASQLRTYTLRPGDVIKLRIWREPDLSGEFPVDEFGRVNFPLVGAFSVESETRESLLKKLVAAYTKSVENLSMDVVFIRRVPVVGGVRTPGLYPVDPTMTVGDAIALAGGPTVQASHATIYLMRSGREILKDVDPALLVSQLPMARGDQLYIPPDDGFFQRNPWVIGTVVQSVVALTAAILTVSRR